MAPIKSLQDGFDFRADLDALSDWATTRQVHFNPKRFKWALTAGAKRQGSQSSCTVIGYTVLMSSGVRPTSFQSSIVDCELLVAWPSFCPTFMFLCCIELR